MFDLEQNRASEAMRFFETGAKEGQKSDSELKNKIKELPSLIQKNGLLITLLHLDEKKFDQLWINLVAHLSPGNDANQFVTSLCEKNAVELIGLTEKAKAYVGWLKRIGAVKLAD
jgi:CRISPR type III-B/RAMP module-associated protein Cmr5